MTPMSTPYCYVYNATQCKAAQNNKNVTPETLTKLCSPQETECVTSAKTFAACVAIWKQNANDSLPEHTDTNFTSTVSYCLYTLKICGITYDSVESK